MRAPGFLIPRRLYHPASFVSGLTFAGNETSVFHILKKNIACRNMAKHLELVQLAAPGLAAAFRHLLQNCLRPLDVERCVDFARRVNPKIEVLRLSARTGEGLDSWFDWLCAAAARKARPAGTGRGSAG